MDENRSGGANGSEPCTVVLFGASGDLAKRKGHPEVAGEPGFLTLGLGLAHRDLRAVGIQEYRNLPRGTPLLPAGCILEGDQRHRC